MIAQFILLMCWYCGTIPLGAVHPMSRVVQEANRPVQPGGMLSDSLGYYLTVEGVQTEATWQNQHLLKVE